MKKKWIAAAVIYIGLFIICCIALYAVPSVKGMLERTYIAEYGSIDVKDEVSAFIVRDEKVYVAAQASEVNRLAETDRLVKANTRIVELTPDEQVLEAERAAEAADEAAKQTVAEAQKQDPEKETDPSDNKTGKKSEKQSSDSGKESSKEEKDDGSDSNIENTGKYADMLAELGDNVNVTKKGYSKTAGYISYYIDGAEAMLSTSNLDMLTKKDFKSLTGRRAVEMPTRKAGRGFPVFKVVKNARWYLVFYIDNDRAARYTKGDTVSIDIGGKSVDVTVSGITEGGKESRITLACKTFFEGFLEERTLDTTVTLISAEGLMLEDSSLVEASDGTLGVFVKDKLGNHKFKPVRVKADDGTHCVVYSDIYVDDEGNFIETIGTYDEIISSPTEEDMAELDNLVKEKKKQLAAEKAAEEKAAAEAAKKAEEEAAKAAEEKAKKEKAEKKKSGSRKSSKSDKAESSKKSVKSKKTDSKTEKESGKKKTGSSDKKE